MATRGRLTARPQPGLAAAAQPGIHALDRGEGLIYVPAAYDAAHPAPLIVMLHGAGGDAMQSIRLLRHVADAEGILLLAPRSHGSTWEVLCRPPSGPDAHEIDRELRKVFSRYAVDPGHVAVAGFSDGASYALSLGLSNGDLFSDVLAFSPGFIAPDELRGKPRVYVAHGTADGVLNINRCSRVLVLRLLANGYPVKYREFAGGHAVPPEVATLAARWFLNRD